MTSLEIVNNEIESLKRSIYSMEKLANKIDKDDMAYGYIKSSSVTSKYRIKNLEQIKQDLEVIYLLAPYLFSCLSDDKKNILIGLHDIINRDLSETDKLFIRTWLKNKNLSVYDKVGDSNAK